MLGIEAKPVRICRILLDVESELEHKEINVFYKITESNHGCKPTNVLRCLRCCLNVRSWLFAAVVIIMWMLSLAPTCQESRCRVCVSLLLFGGIIGGLQHEMTEARG